MKIAQIITSILFILGSCTNSNVEMTGNSEEMIGKEPKVDSQSTKEISKTEEPKILEFKS